MTKVITVFLLLAVNTLFSQGPLLKVYVDTKELNNAEVPFHAFVKTGGQYRSILREKDKFINLPEEVEFHNIEGLRFIIKSDTITFPIGKILEDLKTHPEKNMVDELYTIFKELKKWELRVDNFKYSGNETEKKNNISGDYKIYSLRTTNFKYYIVKERLR